MNPNLSSETHLYPESEIEGGEKNECLQTVFNNAWYISYVKASLLLAGIQKYFPSKRVMK